MSNHSWRMIVVDDELSIQSIVAEVFRCRGWVVDVVGDGDIASQQLETEHYDVVLLDLQLPGKSGLTLLQEIRERWNKSEVIVVTGYATIDSAIKALELDAYAYLTKPFEMADLVSCVQNAQEKLGLERLNMELLEHLSRNEAELQRAVAQATHELARANARLQELAVRDGLTNLFNRRYFDERLEDEISRSIRYGSRLALAMLDVDYFKRYNDTYGHLRGDEALMTIAGALVDTVRRNDIVARYGGEEFAVILVEAGEEEVAVACERIRHAIACAEFHGHTASETISLTASIGYALCPRDGSGKASLISAADRALYGAKSQGRNCVIAASSPVVAEQGTDVPA